MALKARLKRLEALAEWLEWDGRLLKCELQLKILEIQQRMARHTAMVAAKQRLAANEQVASRPPAAAPAKASEEQVASAEKPHPEEPRPSDDLGMKLRAAPALSAAKGLEGCATDGVGGSHPSRRALTRPPQGEALPELPPPAPELPEDPYAPHVGMVRWRPRGPPDDNDWVDDDS